MPKSKPSNPIDTAARYVCPACSAPELKLISFEDEFGGSAANTTTRCPKCGLLRRYRLARLRKA